MAIQRLRPSVWKMENKQSSTQNFRLDYELIEVPASGSVEVQCVRMISYDDSNFNAYRSAPSPQTQSNNVGSILDTSGQSISGEINPFLGGPKK